MKHIFRALKQATQSLGEICASALRLRDVSVLEELTALLQDADHVEGFPPLEVMPWPAMPSEPAPTEWCEEEISEPPIVDVKVVTLVDEATGAVSQQVEVAATQPTKVKVATHVQTASLHATPWTVREKEGISCDTPGRKYAQVFRETHPVGLDKEAFTAMICSVDCDGEMAAYDQMAEMASTTSQMTTYKKLCQLCDMHGLTYGSQRPYDYHEYTLAIIALTRLLERNGVIVSSRSRRSLVSLDLQGEDQIN